MWLFTPASDTFHLCISAALLCVHLLTDLAFGVGQDALIHQLPATCFTSTVFVLAVGSELPPFPVAAAEDMLVVIAHDVA